MGQGRVKIPVPFFSKHDYGYDADGDITSWEQQTDSSSPNTYANSYDKARQLSEALLTTSTGSTVHRYAYGYDTAGNRTSRQTDLSVTSGSYNSLNQLEGTTGGGPLRFSGTVNQNSTVTLDGNPATQSSPTQFTGTVSTTSGTNVVTVVAQDTSGLAATNNYQVVTVPGTAETLAYDFDGNETSDGGHTYEWDVANRLTAINYTSSGNRTQFSYDGMGRRVKIVEKNSSGTVTSTKQFVYVGSTIAEERNASGTVTKQFYPQGMSILSGYSTTGNFYYTRDHLGSVRELLSSTGTITSRLNYDPYGNATVVSGTLLPDFQYAGYYQHAPSGLNLTLFRAYDPNTARWLSRDPSGEKGGINLYAYCNNNTIGYRDPLGLSVWDYVPFVRIGLLMRHQPGDQCQDYTVPFPNPANDAESTADSRAIDNQMAGYVGQQLSPLGWGLVVDLGDVSVAAASSFVDGPIGVVGAVVLTGEGATAAVLSIIDIRNIVVAAAKAKQGCSGNSSGSS